MRIQKYADTVSLCHKHGHISAFSCNGWMCVRFFSRSVRKFGMHACISVYIFAHSEYQETLIRLYGNRYYAVMIHACVVLFAFYSHGGWKFNLKINTNVYFV